MDKLIKEYHMAMGNYFSIIRTISSVNLFREDAMATGDS